MGSKKYWYDNRIYIYGLLFIFFPAALYGLWKSNRFSGKEKYTICSILLALFIIYQITEPPKPIQLKEPQRPTNIEITQSQKKSVPSSANLKNSITTESSNKNASAVAIISAQQELKEHYQELMTFKDSTVFHKMGYGAGNPEGNSWLNKVNTLYNSLSFPEYPLELCSAPDYLRQLGKEYMKNKGSENQHTMNFKSFVMEGIEQ